MKKASINESRIVKALQENESGRKTEDICRELEVSRATFYRWKSQYGGMEEENARLKKMFADLSLDHSILKEVITKKVGALATKAVNARNYFGLWLTCSQGLQVNRLVPL